MEQSLSGLVITKGLPRWGKKTNSMQDIIYTRK